MALKTLVKVSNVTNLSDARYCAGMGVELIGFPINTIEGGLITKYKAIIGWISGVQIVGEFSSADADTINQALELLPLDFIQIPFTKDFSFPLFDKPLALKVDMTIWNESELLDALGKIADKVEWIELKNIPTASTAWAKNAPFFEKLIWAYGFDENTITDFIEHTRPAGIALLGGEEIKVGFKDFEDLAAILEQLEEE